MYVDANDPEDVAFEVKATPAPKVHRYVHPLSKALVIEIVLEPVPAGGNRTGQVDLWSKSRKKLRADAYIDTALWYSGAFRGRGMSKVGLLRSPGTMINAITVGSYDFNAIDDRGDAVVILRGSDRLPMNLGDLSSYSSPGPNRGGVVKPLIVSPGQWFMAPQASTLQGYWPFNGTMLPRPTPRGSWPCSWKRNPI